MCLCQNHICTEQQRLESNEKEMALHIGYLPCLFFSVFHASGGLAVFKDQENAASVWHIDISSIY